MMTLTKRAEAYVAFAKWCHYHDVEPRKVVEVIALQSDLKSNKGNWDQRMDLTSQIQQLMQSMGFTEIKLDWQSPKRSTFRDRYNDLCRLPEII